VFFFLVWDFLCELQSARMQEGKMQNLANIKSPPYKTSRKEVL